jgi:hypothetical protein
MPETLHPPYGPSTIQPRQLNRWLDINSQNGPLTRTRGVLNMPVWPLNSATNWNGTFSEKVLQWNFKCNNNFSLVVDSTYQAFINDFTFSLLSICFVFIRGTVKVAGQTFNIVNRFKAKANLGDTIIAPLYVGQELYASSFQIEFWTTPISSGLPPVGNKPYVLNTSVLGTVDYRYGLDFQLHPNAANFASVFTNTSVSSLNNFSLPVIFPVNTINGINP